MTTLRTCCLLVLAAVNYVSAQYGCTSRNGVCTNCDGTTKLVRSFDNGGICATCCERECKIMKENDLPDCEYCYTSESVVGACGIGELPARPPFTPHPPYQPPSPEQPPPLPHLPLPPHEPPCPPQTPPPDPPRPASPPKWLSGAVDGASVLGVLPEMMSYASFVLIPLALVFL